ncbi:mitochondrial dicarboxylate carrier [Carcharodon carcharias]|uniref:mitochondrial dicarboxylate carrier n=1 Tax=Carcharodon carcharias TaxID=13397 RepID=UPI001B7F0290|nr:mitochondrial dicarboxylate carrier [Carcharodon carcharias]
MAEKRISRWYFGGLASCGAACFTHPLDLLKQRDFAHSSRSAGSYSELIYLGDIWCSHFNPFSNISPVADLVFENTSSALACYDQAKQLILHTGFMSDNIFAHFLSSFVAGGCATFLCQPLDVLKTRLMNSKGEYRSLWHCIRQTAQLGPLGFYKGLIPAGIRLVPHTVLTFVFLEQLRSHFGVLVPA